MTRSDIDNLGDYDFNFTVFWHSFFLNIKKEFLPIWQLFNTEL
jgi:hypothetical protein